MSHDSSNGNTDPILEFFQYILKNLHWVKSFNEFGNALWILVISSYIYSNANYFNYTTVKNYYKEDFYILVIFFN